MKEHKLKEIIKILDIIESMEIWQKITYCTLDYNIEFTKKGVSYDNWSNPSIIIIDDPL